MENVKICASCGKEFDRPVRSASDKRLRSLAQWRKQLHCSKACYSSTDEYRSRQRAKALEKGYGKWMAGKKASVECREKISKSLIGHKRQVGRKTSAETKKKLSDALRGENSHLWRGGKTGENALARSSSEYRQWREAVFSRDDFTCVLCGDRGVKLHADHIQPFALFHELRFDVSNGRTLCVPCHKNTPTYLKSGRALVEANFPAVKIVEV